MPRSLAIKSEYIPQVKRAVKGNGYATQQLLAEELGIGRSTLSLFLNGKHVDYLTAYEICSKLNLDLQEIVDWEELAQRTPSSGPTEEEETMETDFSKYIQRPPLEQRCYETAIQPGSLLRLKSAKGMGKTLLIDKIISEIDRNKYKIVQLSFLQADGAVLNDLDKLGKWFCLVVSRSLSLENEVEKRWEEGLGKINVSYYFEEYLLPSLKKNLILFLEDLDRLFTNQSVADEFLSLFRSWYEQAKTRKIWQQLGLVLAYSTEEYVPADINHSPLNVGVEIELLDFTREQVLELANRYNAGLGKDDLKKITKLVGGHPYLLQKAVYAIAKQQLSLESFEMTATTEEGIYGDRLRAHLLNLEQYPELAEGMKKVVSSTSPVDLGTRINKQLHSLGLVAFEQNAIKPRYLLYREYFRDRLK